MILLLALLVSMFDPVFSLQCINNCTMMYSMNESFKLPSNCSYISTSRCSVKVVFWYERGYYVVTFPGEFLNDPNIDDNSQFIMIETAKDTFFSHDINHVCKDSDDCARYYAERIILEMTKRSFYISKLYSDLRRVLHKKSDLDEDLVCFDSNEALRQCAVSETIGSCQIIDDLIKQKLYRRSCQRLKHESASVNIYDSDGFAMMTVKCNRMFCNGPLTIEAVKNILAHHNITGINGRLPVNSSHLLLQYSPSVLILVLLLSIQFKTPFAMFLLQ